MFLPEKHISMSQSILGFGGIILNTLSEPQTIDMLWSKVESDFKLKKYHSFNNLVLTVNFLYMLNLISIDNKNKIFKL